MPRGKLNEVYVQDIAVNFLKEYYSSKFNAKNIFAGKELCVKKGFGGKRADGLIALKLSEESTFVSVVEAKSYRTLYSLVPLNGNDRWFVHGVLIAIIAVIILNMFINFSLPIRIGLSLSVLLICAFLFWVSTFKLTMYRYIDVLRQIGNYPGHEKWIAFSVDAYGNLDETQKQNFINKLKREGIGLLVISPGKKVNIEIKPKDFVLNKRFKDFLNYYNRCNEIELELIKEYD